jgi:hypothetical protein
VERRGLNLSVTVRLPDAEPEHLGLMDLPERHRTAVTNSLRADAIERWFTPAERARLAHGEATLRDAAHRALHDAVVALENDRSTPALARVVGLAELFESIAGDIPFDVQTRFYHIWKASSDPSTLGGVARALGFATDLQ